MKKLTLVACFFVGALFIVSCAGKDECECNINGNTQVTTEDDINNGQTLPEACAESNDISTASGTGECHMR